MCCRLLILLIVVLKFGDVSAQTFMSEEGPYQMVIVNTTSCASAPLEWFRTNITSYPSKGESLMRGTITTTQDVKDVKFRILMYYLEEEKKTKVFDLKNQNCRNTIVEIILKTISLPFNRQNCKMKAGSYAFSKLNMDAILHTVVQSLWYGAAQLRFEVYQGKTPLMCVDAYYVINKVKAEKAP